MRVLCDDVAARVGLCDPCAAVAAASCPPLPAETDPALKGQIESNYDESTDSFDAMGLKAELLRGVYAYGFERPSAIQQRAIMPVIQGMFFLNRNKKPKNKN